MMNGTIQKDFQPAVDEAMGACSSHFGPDIAAVYLSGSVAFAEAWPGVSDVDWFVFLNREPTDEDVQWAKDRGGQLTRKHPVVAKFNVNLNTIDRLRRERIWRFILQYNSTRLSGRDLVRELESEGIPTPAPDRALARSRVGWLECLVEATAAGRFSETVFTLPSDPHLATRKLARWLVLVEGAHVLMGDDGFVSFRQDDVLCQLERSYPQWCPLFQTARAVLKDPFRAGITPEGFTKDALAFLRWGIERIKANEKGGQ